MPKSNDDWFEAAVDNAQEVVAERPKVSYTPPTGRIHRVSPIPPPNPMRVEEAAKIFDAVAAGMPGLGVGLEPDWGAAPGIPRSASNPEYIIGKLREELRDEQQRNALLDKRLRRAEGKTSGPDQGLAAIVAAVSNAPDPFVASGEWITKVTQAISEARRRAEEPID